MSSDRMGDLQEAAKDNIGRTVSSLKDGMEQSQSASRDSMQKALKTAEQMAAFAHGNMEAMARSSQIMAAGAQDVGHSLAAAARAATADMVAAFKAMPAVRSLKAALCATGWTRPCRRPAR